MNAVLRGGKILIMSNHSASRLQALWGIFTLIAFGLYEEAVELYGTQENMFRSMLLGDRVYFFKGYLYVTDCETWDAYWDDGEWVYND